MPAVVPFKPSKRYTELAVYIGLTCAVGIVILAAALNMRGVANAISSLLSILSPVFYGLAFAYLLRPPTKLFEKWLGRFVKRSAVCRVLALVCTYISVILFFFIFFYFIFPLLLGDGQQFGERFKIAFEKLLAQALRLLQDYVPDFTLKSVVDALVKNFTPLFSFIGRLSGQVMLTTYKVLIGVALSAPIIYHRKLLAASFRRFMVAIFPHRFCASTHRVLFFADKIFGRYLIGKIFEALIVGTLYLIVLLIFRFPYPVLIATIMTITNLVPVIGAYLGAIPSAIILLTENPWTVFWFIVIVLIAEQVDGNLVAPKVIGSVLGLKGIWIMGSVLLFGGLFGIVGMFLSAPLFGIAYMLLRDFINGRLQKKQLSTDSMAYVSYYASPVPPRKLDLVHRLIRRSRAAHHEKEAAESPMASNADQEKSDTPPDSNGEEEKNDTND